MPKDTNFSEYAFLDISNKIFLLTPFDVRIISF